MTYTRVAIERIALQFNMRIAEELVDDGIHGSSVTLQMIHDHALHNYILQVRQEFASKEYGRQEGIVSHPDGWRATTFHAVSRWRILPRRVRGWMASRVKWVHHHTLITHYRICPHIELPAQGFLEHVMFLRDGDPP